MMMHYSGSDFDTAECTAGASTVNWRITNPASGMTTLQPINRSMTKYIALSPFFFYYGE
jgi:hypothetical protein